MNVYCVDCEQPNGAHRCKLRRAGVVFGPGYYACLACAHLEGHAHDEQCHMRKHETIVGTIKREHLAQLDIIAQYL